VRIIAQKHKGKVTGRRFKLIPTLLAGNAHTCINQTRNQSPQTFESEAFDQPLPRPCVIMNEVFRMAWLHISIYWGIRWLGEGGGGKIVLGLLM